MSQLVLGLNIDHGDSAAALVGESGPIAAIAEERLTRKKHCADFPAAAIAEVMRIAGAQPQDLTAIALAHNPRANLKEKALFVARRPLRGLRLATSRRALHLRASASLHDNIAAALDCDRSKLKAPLHRIEHHMAHVASAFYWSPFERAGALTIDGAGDFATAMWADCEGSNIRVARRSCWPHSLGVFYTAICQFIGFERYGEEFKVMGLAAYGSPQYMALMRDMVSFSPKKGLRLNLKYFQHHLRTEPEELIDGVVHIPRHFSDALSVRLGPPRRREEPLTDRERDLAASMQLRYEEVFLQMVEELAAHTPVRDYVFAGGCTLNSVANGRMMDGGHAGQVYFHPAATDDGTAMGAAHAVMHQELGVPRPAPVTNAYLGPEWTAQEIEEALISNGRSFIKLTEDQLLTRAVAALKSGQIMGWFQGREEWGPRALGNRSILCNPAWPGMKATLNARIKNREHFRPFAPAISLEDLSEVFEGSHEVPFMVIVYKVRARWRSRLPAITHADNTGRVQTVTREQNAIYWQLIQRFKAETGIPVLLNTSFNENEPIVHRPKEAIACFERTQMDCLAIGPFWLLKDPSTGPH